MRECAPLRQDRDARRDRVDLPGGDPSAALAQYARLVVDAIDEREDVTLAAMSWAASLHRWSPPRSSPRSLVFVNAMIPVPGETAGQWGDSTGTAEARLAAALARGYSQEFDLAALLDLAD